MKKIMLLSLISLSFIGCNMLCDQYMGSKAENHDLFYYDFGDFDTSAELADYIENKIAYKADIIDAWSQPQQIFERGYGDCDDFSILSLNIYKVELGIEGHIISVDSNQQLPSKPSVYGSYLRFDDDGSISLYRTKAVVSGGITDHATIVVEGYVLDVYTGMVIGEYEELKPYIGYIYEFNTIFN